MRTDLPLRRVWAVLSVLPLVFPSFVGALAYLAATGPRGTLQRFLGPLGVDSVPQITGFEGAFLALTLFSYPYLLLTLLAGLRSVDPSMEEASRALGVGAWRTFHRVVVPQLRVPLAAGSLLVALYVVSDFGAVSILRFDTFTRAIFVQMQSSFDRSAAAVLGLELVALVGLILVVEAVTRSRGRYYTGGGASRRPRRIQLGRWRWPALAFLALLTLAALATPTHRAARLAESAACSTANRSAVCGPGRGIRCRCRRWRRASPWRPRCRSRSWRCASAGRWRGWSSG